MKRNVISIIPVYNERFGIDIVVRDVLRESIVDDCVVVDDGSMDDTAKIAKQVGATVLRLKQNRGSANATKIGLQYAVKNNFKKVVLLDGDGQHDPKYIPDLIQELEKGADVVVGSRYIYNTERSTSIIRKFGTKIISLAIKWRYGVAVHDPTSGFRAINRKTMNYLIKDYPTTFSEPEVIIQLIKAGFRIKEISVPMKKRIYGKSSISLWKAVCLMTFILRKIMFDV